MTWFLISLLAAEMCLGFSPQAPSSRAISPAQLLAAAEPNLPEMKELPSMEPFSHDLDAPLQKEILDDANVTIDDALPLAPPLTFNKFLTMQDKRVVATICYTDGCGLKPYYLTAAKKIKASHPDVIIEKRILPGLADVGSGGDVSFEILVDDKLVGTSQKSRKQRGYDGSVYVSMQEMDLAISKARRKRRPTTLYGGDDSTTDAGMRLEMLRKSREEETGTVNVATNKWND